MSDPLWDSSTRQAKIAAVEDAKRFEAEGGADGALIYDTTLMPVVKRVFDGVLRGRVNQLDRPVDLGARARIGPAELLRVPPGGITLDGVRFNVAIGLRFIEAWLRGVRTWRGVCPARVFLPLSPVTNRIHSHIRTYISTQNMSSINTSIHPRMPKHTARLLRLPERGRGFGHRRDFAVADLAVGPPRASHGGGAAGRFVFMCLWWRHGMGGLIRRAGLGLLTISMYTNLEWRMYLGDAGAGVQPDTADGGGAVGGGACGGAGGGSAEGRQKQKY